MDDRTFIDAVLYRAKTGIPWRDLPERFGSWKTIFNRFSNWSRRGHWAAILKALQLEVDEDGTIIDASIVTARLAKRSPTPGCQQEQ
jgi:transposase